MSSSGSSSAALSTPLGQLVESATAETLITSDWAKNIEVIDLVNAAPECAQDAVQALEAHLRSPNEKVQMLSLALLEGIIKNGSHRVHALVGTRAFLSVVGALTDDTHSAEVRAAALTLLQECGLAFEAQKESLAFHSVYMELRLQGKHFPPLSASSPAVFSPPPQPGASPSPAVPADSASFATSAGAATGADQEEAGLRKLEADLGVVQGGVDKLLEMLPGSRGIEEDEWLAEAVGFLESCQPRLEEVIEAGMEGALSEAMVERALVLHDNIVKALERERSMARPAAQAAELGQGQGQGQGQGGGSTDDLIDLGGGDSKAASVSPAAVPPQGPLPAAASSAGLPPSDDAFANFGPPVTSSGGQQQQQQQQMQQQQQQMQQQQMQQQAQGPPTTTGTAAGASIDRAVLAEADELLQQLSLGHPSEVEQQQQEGKG